MKPSQQIPFLWVRLVAIIIFVIVMAIVKPLWLAGLGAAFGALTGWQLYSAYRAYFRH